MKHFFSQKLTANIRLGLLAAVASGALFTTQVQAQTLTAVMHASLRLTDPVVTTAHITRNHGFMIYDTLLATDAENAIRPQMAEKWEVSDDGKTYTFTLRDGLKWHDGAPVTAEDCVASIQRWAQQDKSGQMMSAQMSEIKALDDKRFSMTFKDATDFPLIALSKPSGITPFIMPKRIAETPANQPIKEFVGSGPFKFVESEFRPGLQVVYEKNTDYVPRAEPASGLAGGKVVEVDRVRWVSMPDSMTSVNALINGEIDYLEQMPYDLLPLVQNNPDVKLEVLDEGGYQTVMRLNHLHPPFDDEKVRLAALYAVGQENVMQAMIGNTDYYETCPAVFGCGLPYESRAGEDVSVPANPAKARELLKEAGYNNTPVIILQPTDTPTVNTQPVVIGQALREAGFNVQMQAMDWQTVVTRRAVQAPPSEGGWNIFATNNVMVEALDPLRAFGVAANGKQAWFGWPDVPEIEELRLRFSQTTDTEERKKLADQIQALVIEKGVLLPMGQYYVPAAFRSSISEPLKSPVPVFWGVSKK
ncbi:ABC transporter substrate-binding protein [Pseudochelatococcus contaminans]|uniref:Peptide/nickel transport system substrate-binding protein n=1 Tax=Pseudochelatococcus contaminans TaxID=1538103 RepID=A0A7W5Z502_9HYPH|nr:ABC transporter substrate-binding protein [Pseudochelatococcus contaminans]MBB3809955.1 peptide/nickel transport system substrate-binding protein [Pseudochelatococcus contaminans]